MKYKNISFDRWSIAMLSELILKKGLSFPNPLVFRDNWVKEITALVRSVVPVETWGCDEDQIDGLIQSRMFVIMKEIMDEYVKLSFGRGWFKIADRVPEAGEHEIFFFLLSHLAQNGHLGTEEEAKSLLLRLTFSYRKDIHEENVAALFL